MNCRPMDNAHPKSIILGPPIFFKIAAGSNALSHRPRVLEREQQADSNEQIRRENALTEAYLRSGL
jgi:hypothetical protein